MTRGGAPVAERRPCEYIPVAAPPPPSPPVAAPPLLSDLPPDLLRSCSPRRESFTRGPGFVEICEWSSYSLAAFIRQVGSAPEIQKAADKIEQYGICGRTLKEEFHDNDDTDLDLLFSHLGVTRNLAKASMRTNIKVWTMLLLRSAV